MPRRPNGQPLLASRGHRPGLHILLRHCRDDLLGCHKGFRRIRRQRHKPQLSQRGPCSRPHELYASIHVHAAKRRPRMFHIPRALCRRPLSRHRRPGRYNTNCARSGTSPPLRVQLIPGRAGRQCRGYRPYAPVGRYPPVPDKPEPNRRNCQPFLCRRFMNINSTRDYHMLKKYITELPKTSLVLKPNHLMDNPTDRSASKLR